LKDGFVASRVSPVSEGLPGSKVHTLYSDSTGRLWITTENDGILAVTNPNSDGIHLSCLEPYCQENH